MIPLPVQVKTAVEQYAATCMAAAGEKDIKVSKTMQEAMALTVKQAMLSGMSLTAHFLAANEGHPQITPQAFEKAVLEVGKEYELVCEQLSSNFIQRMEDERKKPDQQ